MTLTHWLIVVGSIIVAWVVAFYKTLKPVASTDHSELVLPVVQSQYPDARVQPPVSPQNAPTATITPIVAPDKVRLCAMAQQAFEGYFPGSSSYRHNNPGNLKDLSGNFITFPSYELGFLALEDYIRRVATGKHKAYPKGGQTTIQEYTLIYTSDPAPSPQNYALAIAKATGLNINSKMVELLG